MNRKALLLSYLMLLLTATGFLYGQTDKKVKEDKDCQKVRSGLSGTIGYSRLHLDDAILPEYNRSQYYNLTKDIFLTVGATIKFHPDFFKEGWYFRFDPEFAKFSYGSDREQTKGSITSSLDIDVESIKIPFGIEYDFLPDARFVHPIVRAGGSISFMIDSEVSFESYIFENDTTVLLEERYFNFTKWQHTLFLSGGFDFMLWNWDFTAELVYEKGDGIHKDKWGESFLKISNTSNYFIRLGVLF
jgi:hypothetical protein